MRNIIEKLRLWFIKLSGHKIIGRVRVDICGTDGVIRSQGWWKYNLTMNAGLAVFAGLAGNVGSQIAWGWLALGTSSTAVSASQTTLSAEITDTGLQRAAATVTRITTNQTNDTLQLSKTFTATGTKAIEEVGYFNASSAGVMGGRKLTGTKTVNNGETATFVYQIIFT